MLSVDCRRPCAGLGEAGELAGGFFGAAAGGGWERVTSRFGHTSAGAQRPTTYRPAYSVLRLSCSTSWRAEAMMDFRLPACAMYGLMGRPLTDG